ncbi:MULTISPECIES: TetR/AcrR family transcriptional regulator [unclassified Streptomyces]|uniref:TetR/AcrR family transcriptional regulator n=1 Tax=unclassified Streptomyces TaxID=2593676 RepID=UPI00340CEAB9
MSAVPTPKGKQRREALLDAAEHILASSGGSELTLRAVADAASVRLGHLQYYFPSRSALLTALLSRILDTSLERVARLAAPPDGDGITALLDGVLADHDDQALVRLFTEVWVMAAHDGEAAEAVRDFYDRYAAHVTELLDRQGAGAPRDDARQRAEVFVMLMEGAALFRSGVAGRRSTATDARLRRTLHAVLTGVDG